MNEKEAIKTLIIQLRNWDDWQSVVLDSLLCKKELCKHPQPMGKDDTLMCMICQEKITEKQIHRTWKAFVGYEQEEKAIELLEKKILED